MNPIQMFKLARAYGKFQSVEKENVAMNKKILQIAALLVTLFGTFGVPEFATKWIQGHVIAYAAVVGLAGVLHAILPSIFSGKPSQADEDSAGKDPGPVAPSSSGATLKVIAWVLLAVGFGMSASAQSVQNIYAMGLSYNAGETGPQAFAGTALQAHEISPDTAPGMYQFAVMDIVPNTVKPFTVNTNLGVGIAQKIATIKGLAIYAPTAAGPTFNGSNVGYNWSGGITTAIPFKGFYIMPSLRFNKASIGGDGYKLIPGLLLGWGK